MKWFAFNSSGKPYRISFLVKIQQKEASINCPKEGIISLEQCWRCGDFLEIVELKYIVCDYQLRQQPDISDTLCRSMHREALKRSRRFSKNGVSGRTITGGLELVLFYRPFKENRIILRFSHPNRAPTDAEVEICKAKFFGECKLISQSRKENTFYMSIARSSIHGGAGVWHKYYRKVNPEDYIKHQQKAGKSRHRQLKRLLGEEGYKEYQRRLAQKRWNAS